MEKFTELVTTLWASLAERTGWEAWGLTTRLGVALGAVLLIIGSIACPVCS